MADGLHWVVPGALNQRTGGYIYDRRIVEGLRALGWTVRVHELRGRHPDADDEAVAAAAEAATEIGSSLAVIDGLALPAFADHIDRLDDIWVGLIHHPLSMETGLTTDEIARMAAIEGPLMRRSYRLVVTSPGTRRDLAAFDLDPSAITVITPGVDPAPLARGSGSGSPTSLLTVGSLTRRKGHLTLIAALAKLEDLPWHLNLVGSAAWDPDHAAEIRRAIAHDGLEERVAVIGEQDEAGLAQLYDGADLFVLASHHEGYGMVLSEALARGLPIVSTTAGAIPETVPGEAGRLVPPDDQDAMAAALRAVLTEPEVYGGLAKGAQAARGRLTSWTQAAAQFNALLKSVPAPTGAAGA